MHKPHLYNKLKYWHCKGIMLMLNCGVLFTDCILPCKPHTSPVVTPETTSPGSHCLTGYLGSQSRIGRSPFIFWTAHLSVHLYRINLIWMKTLDGMTSSASCVLTRRLCSAVLVNFGSLGLGSHEPGQRPGLSRYVVTLGNHFHENTRPSYCLNCLSGKICFCCISSVRKKEKQID